MQGPFRATIPTASRLSRRGLQARLWFGSTPGTRVCQGAVPFKYVWFKNSSVDCLKLHHGPHARCVSDCAKLQAIANAMDETFDSLSREIVVNLALASN